ncbi:MSMEG_0565 family glycosyltransferase [Nocardia sp. NBC_00565]|uniref:MSMEG_0565 family glycosyltransferase n=1 Tax=Nocardia sp. NBC_00565 TaxID=2975993 RepID=UPI002E80DDEC|nr:MSMEG_0565 family glycosyltransferase [Nocardia sp. NBC_00565]WUB99844.1 MSMEG_0565 family glycosyltransferase [Nocardia sp. NBC_00565]
MRIALLSYSTKPRGGVVHTLNLAEALAGAGAEVTVWTLGRGGDSAFFRPVDPRVHVEVVPFEANASETVGQRIIRSIEVLRKAFAPGHYDIVHAQDCISANAVGHCIRTIHHLDQFTTPELAACHERAIVRPYARICVSAAVAEEVRAGWGFEPTVIPNGVEYERFAAAAGPGAIQSARRADWRERFGPYVLAVGGIEPRKGSLDLLEAFAVFARDAPAQQLVIAGGETLFDYREYRAGFDARATELGIEPVVLGTVEHTELPALVAAASVLPFLSTKEGFGLAAMEALAAGTPVVARDLPVLREVFADAVEFASTPETMAEAMTSAIMPDTARRARGKALAAEYSWDTAASAHLDFYLSALADAMPPFAH